MQRALTLAALALATALPAPLLAQDTDDALTEITGEGLDAIAARIPERDWYPEGYHDIRVAAEADYLAAEEARIAQFVATTGEPVSAYYGDWDQVNLGDCDSDDLGEAPEDDPSYMALVYLAKDMAQFRFRLEREGYPADLLDTALEAYERWRLADIAIDASGRDPSTVDYAQEFGVTGYDPDNYALGVLLDTLNAARTGEYADLPEAIMADGCGGEGFPVIVRTAPGGGQVWVMSAFAFRVCSRREDDPWDKMACRWNEVETGSPAALGGRYVYEVRWPDGTTRRGTREIRGDYMESGATTVTFRKTGS